MPIFLLSNSSNPMCVKLDHSDYILWKHQLISILEEYPLLRFVDGTLKCPENFLYESEGNFTSVKKS